jgi:WD40 repeat protein
VGETVTVWEVASGVVRTSASRKLWSPKEVRFGPRGHSLFVAAIDDSSVREWDLTTGKFRREFKSPAGKVCGLALSPDGKTMAVGDPKGTVTLWDLAGGKERAGLTEPQGKWAPEVSALEFSPDGATLAVGTGSAEYPGRAKLRLWDVTNRRPLWQQEFSDPICSVSFAPDGKGLAFVEKYGPVRLCDAATGKVRANWRSKVEYAESVTFAPGGRVVAVAGYRQNGVSAIAIGQVGLYDPATGAELLMIETPHDFESVAFSPDGKLLAVPYEVYNVDLHDIASFTRKGSATRKD